MTGSEGDNIVNRRNGNDGEIEDGDGEKWEAVMTSEEEGDESEWKMLV